MNKSMLCAGLLALLSLVASQFANAASCIWTGGSLANSNWSSAANWNNCGGAHAVPVNGDTLGFPDGVPRLTNTNDIVKLIAAKLVIAGPVNLSGLPIGLSDGIAATVPLASTSPVVNLNIVLETNAQTFQCSGAHKALTLSGTVSLNNQALTLDSACSIFLTGKITGTGSITKIGTTTAFLEGATSNYTGVTTINAGKVRVVSSAGLGASGPGNETVVNDGAALELEDIATAEDLTLSGTGISSQGALFAAAGNNTLTGAITLAASSNIGAAAGMNLSIEGAIDGGNVSLVKVGAGTVALQNVNTYTNTTIVSGGVLEVNGQVDFAGVNTGTTLAGAGIATDGINIQPGAVFSPGTAAGANIGSFNSSVMAWNGTGTLVFQLGVDSAHSDQLAVTSFNSVGTGFEFQFGDGATPPVPGVAYTLVSFTLTNFTAGDFSFTYAGTGPGSSMTGTFAMTATQLQFTPATVVSDLVFHDGFE
jgi:autotransporter-associated beta strand protein